MSRLQLCANFDHWRDCHQFFTFRMANLLAKLRIKYSSLVLLQGVFDPPKERTVQMHAKLLHGFLEGQNDQCFVTNAEQEKMREKTYLHLRLREMLREHSNKASMIVMSLPMPRQVRKTLTCGFLFFNFHIF